MTTQKSKEDIIEFIKNSPDEENLHIAIFIAGMQAQKALNGGTQPQDAQQPTHSTA